MTAEVKQKIRDLSQSDIDIANRRALYNQMSRRMKNGQGLPAGLVAKYQACQSSTKERFKLPKEFLICEDMSGPQNPFCWNLD